MPPTTRDPIALEVLEFLASLEADPARRRVLASGYAIYEVAVTAELIDHNNIDQLAQRMQELATDALITHGPKSAGVVEPPMWNGGWIQAVHDWRLTADGYGALAAFRDGRPSSPTAAPERTGATDHPDRDIFISHASEDKVQVARPLAEALQQQGWTVWLDELELTVGDSLYGRINSALARSRFGVVVLSPSFFSKEWPQDELAGLAAREVDTGSKIILPVWHQIDRRYLVERLPIMADRLGALTTDGIQEVATQLSRALLAAGHRSVQEQGTEPLVQAVLPPRRGGVDATPAPISKDNAARIALARVLIDKGSIAEAEQHLNDAVANGDTHAMLLLGMIAGDRGDLDDSVRWLKQALNAGHQEALTPLGIALHDLGRLDEAETYLQRAARS